MTNNILKYIITSVIVTLIISLVASYAYFAISTTGVKDNTTVNAIFNSVPIVTFSSSADAFMDVNVDEMTEDEGSNDYTKYKSGTATLKVDIENPDFDITTNCAYSIVYKPTETYYATQNVYTEYSLSGVATTSNVTTSPIIVSELDLSGVDSELTIINDKTISVAGANQKGSLIWTFTFKYYNLGVDQSANMGKQIAGELQFKNVNCTLAAS